MEFTIGNISFFRVVITVRCKWSHWKTSVIIDNPIVDDHVDPIDVCIKVRLHVVEDENPDTPPQSLEWQVQGDPMHSRVRTQETT